MNGFHTVVAALLRSAVCASQKRTYNALILSGTVFLVALAALAQDPAAPTFTGEPIRLWQVCGPFDSPSILEPVVEKEEAVAPPPAGGAVKGRAWSILKSEAAAVDLESPQALGPADRAAAFAFAEIESEKDGDVLLGFGSDDAAMVWWNGRAVLVQDVRRAVKPGEDQVVLRMRKGRNTLLVKVWDEIGGWGFAADLRPAGAETWAWKEVLPMTDDELLDLVERTSFDFLWQECEPATGMIVDSALERAGADPGPASLASVGFGLSAICIGAERGWVSRGEARERVLTTLGFVLDKLQHEHGFLYHFVDMKTGQRAWDCEISSIDTALFLAGALTARSFFNDAEITKRVNQLYARVDFPWMLNGGDTLSMGWVPGSGFIGARWGSYSEHMVLYLLGLGAPERPLPPESWAAWTRPLYTYKDMTYVQAVPLFLHQYSHAWVDFRDKRDAYADYFRNSALATKAHRAFCLELKDRFPAYGENLWGLTASKGPKGYMVWGGPPPTLEFPIDGSVVPCAAAGSVPFVPDLTIPVLREIYDRHKAAWGRYGLLDAFNPNNGWVADGYIGIDVGAQILMIENHRTGNVWKWFMECPEIRKAMKLAGFKETGRDLDKADLEFLRRLAKDTWDCIAYFVEPKTGMPYDTSARAPHTSATNLGLYLAALAAARDMGFISAAEALERAGRILDGIEKFPSWKGFAQCWHGVQDFQPSQDDIWVSVVDTGNLALGLVAAGQAFPELAARCRKLVDAMDWSAIYDAKADQLYGGYDMKNNKLNPDWRIDMLATDSRGALFMAIASGQVPSSAWDKLKRDTEERYHVKVLKPGWVAGGLFMQYITGIFLDERNSVIGRSAANLAYENMRHADAKSLPAWGWSSCLDPDGGYLGWGKLRDEVVTPHASVLAIEDYPKEVVWNLYELQRRGARAPWEEDGQQRAFGFRDSINLASGRVSKDYLVLDQGMLFLSLANFLENGLVRRYFHADPSVKAGFEKISELSKPEGGENVSVFEPGLGALIPQEQVSKSVVVPRLKKAPKLDGDLSDWEQGCQLRVKFPGEAEFGTPPNKDRFEGTFVLAWDDANLYVGADVLEDEVACEQAAAELYKDDAIEMFFDPAADGFVWGNAADFQIGVSPSGPGGKPQVYSWFQKTVPPGSELAARTRQTPAGAEYTVELKIPWAFLGVSDPKAGRALGASFALHTVDQAHTASAKINWSYRSDVDKIHLGEIRLGE